MHRLFVALRLPAAIREALLDLADDPAALRWQDEEQLHLTLRFIGEVERPVAEDIAAALGTIRFPRFDLSLAGVGRFESRRRGTLWAGIKPKDAVRALATKVERACQSAGQEPERRAFHPHVTVARWSGASSVDPWLARHAGLSSEPWPVASFTLFESHLGRHGPSYETIADYPLG